MFCMYVCPCVLHVYMFRMYVHVFYMHVHVLYVCPCVLHACTCSVCMSMCSTCMYMFCMYVHVFYMHVHVLYACPCVLHACTCSVHIRTCKVYTYATQARTYVCIFLQAIFIPLQGFLNSIVYGWSRKEFRQAVSVGERIQYRRRGQDYESLNNQSRVTGSVMYGGTVGSNKGT